MTVPRKDKGEGANTVDRSEEADLSLQLFLRDRAALTPTPSSPPSWVKECVTRVKSVNTSLPRALGIWNTTFGSYESSIRSHLCSNV